MKEVRKPYGVYGITMAAAGDPGLKIMGFLIFSKQPLGPERLAVMDRYAEKNNWSYLYRPGGKVDSAFTQFVESFQFDCVQRR